MVREPILLKLSGKVHHYLSLTAIQTTGVRRNHHTPVKGLLNISGSDRNIAAQTEILITEISVCTLDDIPNAVPINGDVCFAVAVVVARHGFVGCQAPLISQRRIIRASQNKPNAASRNLSENRKVRSAVAVVIARNDSVAVCAERLRPKSVAATLHYIPSSV